MPTAISTVLSKQIPEFVREDNPGFVEFMEAYYEFLDQSETRTIESVKDLDQSLDTFSLQFKKELDILGEFDYQNIDRSLLLRKIKQVYTAKGTEEAYKFLFKIISGQSIDVSYPWNSTLKASGSKWIQNTSIFVKAVDTSITKSNFLGNKISIINNAGKNVEFYAKNVKLYSENIFEVSFDINYNVQFDVHSDVYISGKNVGSIVPTINNTVIENGGIGWSRGDIITVNAMTTSGVVAPCIIKVLKVDSNGAITKIEIVKFGADYVADFFLFKDSGASTGGNYTNNLDITYGIVDGGAGNTLSPLDDSNISSYSDSGSIFSPNYWETSSDSGHSYSFISYTGTQLTQFYEESVITTGSSNSTDFTLIRFTIGSIAKYPGYYASIDGHLSDEIYIQDSKYWQKYSYVLRLNESIDKYTMLLKSYIHPAGTALFGDMDINTVYSNSISGVSNIQNNSVKTDIAGIVPSSSVYFIESTNLQVDALDGVYKDDIYLINNTDGYITHPMNQIGRYPYINGTPEYYAPMGTYITRKLPSGGLFYFNIYSDPVNGGTVYSVPPGGKLRFSIQYFPNPDLTETIIEQIQLVFCLYVPLTFDETNSPTAIIHVKTNV